MMKTLRSIMAAAALAGALAGIAAPASAEFQNGELVRIIVYPDGTVVY